MSKEENKASNEAKENKEAQKAPEAKTESNSKTTKKSSKKKSSGGKKKVKVLCHNAAGKYLLAYSYGDVAVMDAKQADELIDAGDAKEVK